MTTKKFMERFRLDGKVAVITGGAGLIGKELCKGFSEAGASVVIADLDVVAGKKLEKELGAKSRYLELDITSEESINDLIKSCDKDFGGIDIWVNAAYPRTKDWGLKFEEIPYKSWAKNVDMHMNGYFLCCQKAAEYMKSKKKGNIINFGSIYGVLSPKFPVYGETGMTSPAAYSAIKGGIINLSRYLAAYYAPHGVRVNAVCPGGVFDNQDKRFVKEYSKNTPLGRMANADELVGPVIFLASDAASYVTGHVLMVDGGWSIW